MSALSAARGVSNVMNRCEEAKVSGFLDLSDCELLYLADALYLVLRGFLINRCSLRNNKLKKFPMKLVTKFPAMNAINLEGNQLTELPADIAKWTQLRGINLARNQLTTFPDALLQCEQLALLDLSGNMIQEIDVARVRSKLPALKQLHIRDNPLCQNTALIAQLCAEVGPQTTVVYK